MSLPSTSSHDGVPRLSWPLAIARALAAIAVLAAAGWLLA